MVRQTHLRLGLLSLLLVPLGAFAAESVAEKPILGNYVPEDVWLYLNFYHSPERDFIDAHWDRVFQAVRNSGVGTELKNVITAQVPESDRAQFDEFWSTTERLVSGVHWGDLISREVVFAERMQSLVPDIMFLCRPEPATLNSSVEGLAEIMRTLAGLSTSVRLTESTTDGARIWSLEIENAPFGFFLLHQGEVVGIFLGRGALEDVQALMSGQSQKTCLLRNARYQKALAEVPPAEFAVTYFDLDRLFAALPRLPEKMFGNHTDEDWATVARVVRSVIEHFDFFDYVISTGRMEGVREQYDTYVRLKPGTEEKPLRRMLTSGKPFDNFQRYVPADASGFSVSSGINLTLLYETILDVIGKNVPNGADLLVRWDQAQKEIGFDVRADLLNWISGECVSVQMPSVVQSPFGSGGEGVLMMRVSDPVKAREQIGRGVEKLKSLVSKTGQPFVFGTAPTLEGFHTVMHPMMAMMMIQPCVGVWEDWLVVSTSERAVQKVIDTAAGKIPSILENARFKAEGVTARGPVASASFTDLSRMGQELGAAFFAMGFVGGVIPNEPETQVIKGVFNALVRLAPAVTEINFLNSKSEASTFDGTGWRSTLVTNYKPAEPAATAVPTAAASAAAPGTAAPVGGK